ncbi:MAG: hypothetical protein JJ894_05430 [Dinoroseobacter sp.]|nr:hypothetical protein [Dinoroseobacter sp.]
MSNQLAPSMFTRVMSLPENERADVLEMLGALTVDEAKLSIILEEITADLENRKDDIRH